MPEPLTQGESLPDWIHRNYGIDLLLLPEVLTLALLAKGQGKGEERVIVLLADGVVADEDGQDMARKFAVPIPPEMAVRVCVNLTRMLMDEGYGRELVVQTLAAELKEPGDD